MTDGHGKSGSENVRWDLSDLYTGPEDPAINTDLDKADELARTLSESYRGRLERLSAGELESFLRSYEAILELSGRVGTYAYLYWSTNAEDPARGALLQRATERSSRLHQNLLFVELEWAALSDDRLGQLATLRRDAHQATALLSVPVDPGRKLDRGQKSGKRKKWVAQRA